MIKVLIVDDDFMVAKVHAGFIQRTPGFTVVGAAHTGAQAVADTERLQPDLVLLDIHLPDINGLDLMHRLRAVAPELDVLVISAAREVETVRKALRGGIVHYLIKPFSQTDLQERLEHYRNAYQGLEQAKDVAEQSDVNRVFGLDRTRTAATQGLQHRDPEAGGSRPARRRRRPLRSRGGRAAGHVPRQRPPLPRVPARRRDPGRPAQVRRGPAGTPLRPQRAGSGSRSAQQGVHQPGRHLGGPAVDVEGRVQFRHVQVQELPAPGHLPADGADDGNGTPKAAGALTPGATAAGRTSRSMVRYSTSMPARNPATKPRTRSASHSSSSRYAHTQLPGSIEKRAGVVWFGNPDDGVPEFAARGGFGAGHLEERGARNWAAARRAGRSGRRGSGRPAAGRP